MTLCEIGYRYIEPMDFLTPKCYIPIQRMRIEVAKPYGNKQVKDALIKFFGEDWFISRDLIIDIECYPPEEG